MSCTVMWLVLLPGGAVVGYGLNASETKVEPMLPVAPASAAAGSGANEDSAPPVSTTSEPPGGGRGLAAIDMLIDGLLRVTAFPLLAALASMLLAMLPTASTTLASIACCSAALVLGLFSTDPATEESALVKLPAADVEIVPFFPSNTFTRPSATLAASAVRIPLPELIAFAIVDAAELLSDILRLASDEFSAAASRAGGDGAVGDG